MTSNQIAYQSNVEANRHNEVVEQETERHNKALESLQDEANAINEEKNRITETYNYRMAELQEQYNNWYAKFTEANEKQKRNIDWKLAGIKEDMNSITEEHNRRMEEIGFQEADIKSRTLEETKNYNSFLKAQSIANVSMEWWFKEKSLDYQNRALEETSSYHTGLLVNESTRETHEYVLGQERNRQGWQGLLIDTQGISMKINDFLLRKNLGEGELDLKRDNLTVQTIFRGLDFGLDALEKGTKVFKLITGD